MMYFSLFTYLFAFYFLSLEMDKIIFPPGDHYFYNTIFTVSPSYIKAEKSFITRGEKVFKLR